jgi:hypothetical protein
MRDSARSLVCGVLATVVASSLLTLIPASPSSADLVSDGVTSSSQTVVAQQFDPYVSSSPMPDLKVTVSQTKDLTSQAVLVSWTGGKASTRPNADDGGTNFLQIAQCWGDDPNDSSRPDRTTCQYGLSGIPGSTRDNFINTKTVDSHDSDYTAGTSYGPDTSYVAVPFKASTGEVVNPISTDDKGNKTINFDIDPNNNQFFTNYTNNQVKWAGSDESGVGYSKFEIQTVMQSPALGCGTPVVNGNVATGQSCWLVVIPRGVADNGQNSTSKSGLLWDTWKHALAVKLNFRPVGVRCSIGAAEKQISGSELIARAVSSWQPKLCGVPGGSAYVLSTGNEADSLTTAASDPNSPLALTSEPLAAAQGQDPLLYAPVAMSGVVVSFAIDRSVTTRGKVPQAYRDNNFSPFSTLRITPRLLAKLLTASYVDSLPPADKSHINFIDASHPGKNARNLTKDPDFLSVNDVEWKYQNIIAIGLSDAITPLGRSDMADKVWSYIMSDADARDFMNGEPDPWGMVVNPWYSVDAATNPSGAALDLSARSFAKADPIEVPDTTSQPFGSGAINLVTWRPYVSDFDTAAYKVLRGDPMALGPWNAGALPPAYSKTTGAFQGNQRVIALSTASSAAKYACVNASLMNPAGVFVAPTLLSMSAAQAAMTPSTNNKQVLNFDFASDAAKAAEAAYPLTMPVYAAVNPTLLNADLRAPYAAFIKYAATLGQQSGTDVGQLPPGYAPLATGLVQQALQDASLVAQGAVHPNPSPNPTDSVPTGTPTDNPTPQPTGNPVQISLGPITPKDPANPVSSGAVPFSFAAGMFGGFIYPRIGRKRDSKKTSQRKL